MLVLRLGCLVGAALLVGGCFRLGFDEAPDAQVTDLRAPSTVEASVDGAVDGKGETEIPLLDANTLDAQAPPDAAYSSQSLAVAHTLDDGEICSGWNNEWYPNGEGIGISYAGYYATGGVPVWGYFRFKLKAAIPAGSKVASVQLTLRGRSVYQWQNNRDALQVAAEKRASAVQVAGPGDRPGGTGGTTLTSTTVRWPATGPLVWKTTGDNVSPDLSPVLQELVTSSSGLAAGAYVQLWIKNPDTTVDAEVGAEDFSYAKGSGKHARLGIGWYQP